MLHFKIFNVKLYVPTQTVRLKLVWDCFRITHTATGLNGVAICWVPGHQAGSGAVVGNDARGAVESLVSTREPFT